MLTDVCQYLAKAIARVMVKEPLASEVQVSGATDEKKPYPGCQDHCFGSSLVKSAIFGRDPQLGHIAATARTLGSSTFDQKTTRELRWGQ